MKKKLLIGALIISLLCVGLLGGCVLRCPYLHPLIFNLCGWSSSDSAFNNCINNLKTPKEICQYMADNFHGKYVLFGKSPYSMWTNTWGDCRDFSCFGRYVAQKHGYTAYDLYMLINVPGTGQASHINGVYIEDSGYSYSNCAGYRSGFSSFQAIVDDYCRGGITCCLWVVYDDCRKILSSKGITATTKFINPGGSSFASFIGEEPKNRTNYLTGDRTIVNKGNPALYSGTLENIGIWSYNTLYNVEVATFYRPDPSRNPDKLSTRSYQTIGTVYGGSAREYKVSLNVQEGDYIGIYFTDFQRAIELDTSGYAGIWHQNLDRIPCTNLLFNSMAGDAISLGGVVITW